MVFRNLFIISVRITLSLLRFQVVDLDFNRCLLEVEFVWWWAGALLFVNGRLDH